MNILPAEVQGGYALFNGQQVALEGPVTGEGGRTEIGIRPEHVSLGATGIPARVHKVADVGRHAVVEARAGETSIKAVVQGASVTQGAEVYLQFRPEQTRLYRDGWISSEASA